MRIKTLIVSSVIAFTGMVGMATTFYQPAYAQCTTAKDCLGDGVRASGGSNNGRSIGSLVKNIVNALLYILGAVAVLMIVIGGIKYTTSNGDSSAVSGAKNTILYAVIGLVVAMLAYAIVNFVISNL